MSGCTHERQKKGAHEQLEKSTHEQHLYMLAKHFLVTHYLKDV